MAFKRLSKTSNITICAVNSQFFKNLSRSLIIQIWYFPHEKDSLRGDVIVEYEPYKQDVIGYHVEDKPDE